MSAAKAVRWTCLSASPKPKTKISPPTNRVSARLTAIIGGLLGAAVFIGAYFLLPGAGEERAFDGQYIIAILGFLTAFLVYFGYRLFSKKKTAASGCAHLSHYAYLCARFADLRFDD